jgi:hypothetical protein
LVDEQNRRWRKVQRIERTEKSRRTRAFHRPGDRLIDPSREAQQPGFARTILADDSNGRAIGRHSVDIDERRESSAAEGDGHKSPG